MKYKIISLIRSISPLYLRQKVGPIFAYFSYVKRIYLQKSNNIKVLSIDETIDIVKNEKLSVIRFGDGEMSLIEGSDLAFQNHNENLADKLKIILQSNNDKLLICVPGIFGKLNNFTKRAYWFSLHHVFRYGYVWKKNIEIKNIYGDAFITRPYLTFKDKSNCTNIFNKLFLIWRNERVVLIEGEKSRLGVGNNMFDEVSSLERILCPAENAFDKYLEIKKEVLKINKNKLILISLGPTAKILAYDLFLLGYRVIDIGHVDMEYEMFLRNENKIVKVDYKYFNEISERNPEECQDDKYISQIIAKI